MAAYLMLTSDGQRFDISESAGLVFWAAMQDLGMLVELPEDAVLPDGFDPSAVVWQTRSPGVPWVKLESRHGFWVTASEISAALSTYQQNSDRAARSVSRWIEREIRALSGPSPAAEALGSDPVDRSDLQVEVDKQGSEATALALLVMWRDWIAFLRRASELDGFGVY